MRIRQGDNLGERSATIQSDGFVDLPVGHPVVFTCSLLEMPWRIVHQPVLPE
jgi:hypothetical protein